MAFYPDPAGESYLAYLERLDQFYPDRKPLDYDEFLKLQREFDRFYTPAWDELESAGHPITHPALSKIRMLEDRLAI